MALFCNAGAFCQMNNALLLFSLCLSQYDMLEIPVWCFNKRDFSVNNEKGIICFTNVEPKCFFGAAVTCITEGAAGGTGMCNVSGCLSVCGFRVCRL